MAVQRLILEAALQGRLFWRLHLTVALDLAGSLLACRSSFVSEMRWEHSVRHANTAQVPFARVRGSAVPGTIGLKKVARFPSQPGSIDRQSAVHVQLHD